MEIRLSLLEVVSEGSHYAASRGVWREVEYLDQATTDTICQQFDAYCKRVMKRRAINYLMFVNANKDREIGISDLSDKDWTRLSYEDIYPSHYTCFNLRGENVAVVDDILADALKQLPEDWREIILRSYFGELSDREIGLITNTSRSTVQYRRLQALKKLRERMIENQK